MPHHSHRTIPIRPIISRVFCSILCRVWCRIPCFVLLRNSAMKFCLSTAESSFFRPLKKEDFCCISLQNPNTPCEQCCSDCSRAINLPWSCQQIPCSQVNSSGEKELTKIFRAPHQSAVPLLRFYAMKLKKMSVFMSLRVRLI